MRADAVRRSSSRRRRGLPACAAISARRLPRRVAPAGRRAGARAGPCSRPGLGPAPPACPREASPWRSRAGRTDAELSGGRLVRYALDGTRPGRSFSRASPDVYPQGDGSIVAKRRDLALGARSSSTPRRRARRARSRPRRGLRLRRRRRRL
ncbi:MAG: hypothetical protein MZV64_10700 [Ignavibacteriales bacterium]|nr:hypothetical protein [Ignavibacteriales bacterium]